MSVHNPEETEELFIKFIHLTEEFIKALYMLNAYVYYHPSDAQQPPCVLCFT